MRLTERTKEGQAIPRMDLKNNGYEKCIERLAEYEEMEEHGMILELCQYRAAGTIWECRKAMKKREKKKPANKMELKNFAQEIYAYRGDCPVCGKEGLESVTAKYCPNCGQALDWEKNG